MIRRVRMAPKRLAIAREREQAGYRAFFENVLPTSKNISPAWDRWSRRGYTLRAIERRKDRIA